MPQTDRQRPTGTWRQAVPLRCLVVPHPRTARAYAQGDGTHNTHKESDDALSWHLHHQKPCTLLNAVLCFTSTVCLPGTWASQAAVELEKPIASSPLPGVVQHQGDMPLETDRPKIERAHFYVACSACSPISSSRRRESESHNEETRRLDLAWPPTVPFIIPCKATSKNSGFTWLWLLLFSWLAFGFDTCPCALCSDRWKKRCPLQMLLLPDPHRQSTT